MPRALFEKRGNALYISHLDLMRLFQRAFKRAGLNLTHTKGFNPRPSVSIALPLSLGVESGCELLDFELEGQKPDNAEICRRLNEALVEGVRVLEVYDDMRKLKDLAFLDCCVVLEYDNGVPSDAENRIRELFAQPSLTVEKKGKNGITQQDIIPMIRSLAVEGSDREICLKSRICCQNPSLNPMQLGAAIEKYLPDLKPDFIRCCRIEVYDTKETVFR